jgi:hypothetical protein
MLTKNVLIIGWFGASKKQLNKFSDLYKKIGYNSNIVETPILESISYQNWKQWRKYGLPNRYKNTKYDRVHIFSGGIFQYHNWILHDKINKIDSFGHSSIVFDSSPFFPLSNQVSRYSVNVIPYIKNIPKSDKIISNIVDKYWKINKYQQFERFEEFKNNINCGRKKILIISKNDNLLDHNLIEEQIKLWKNNSTEVIRSNDFIDSNHLKHYKLYPEEYIDMLLK